MKIFRAEFLIFLVLIGVGVLGLMNGGYFTVNPGEVAVKIRLGKLVDAYEEGFFFKIPIIEKVEKFSIKIKRTDIKTEAFSKDLQPISLVVVVNHRIEKQTVESIYRNLGINYEKTIIEPLVEEEVKAVFANFSAESVVSNRSTVTQNISQIIKERLLLRQLIVTDLSLVDFDFSEAFLKSVEDKQIASQRAQKALKDVETAKNEAEQMFQRASAEARALQLQRAAVSPTLIELRRVEALLKAVDKWDGKLPHYNGGAIPFIDLSKGNVK